MVTRIIVFLTLLFSALFFPFWATAILAIVTMFYFKKYFEATIVFLISDVLYGVTPEKYLNLYFLTFILAVAIYFLIEFLKKKLKFYPVKY